MQRYVLTRRFLERAALERPVILWLEDAHWSSEALAFADYMMRVQRLAPCPVMLVLTARSDVLEEQPRLKQQFSALLRYPRASRMQLSALAPQERRSLVQALLVLEEDLARQVEERTAGNPQFTIQLVGDWVERGLLEVGKEGFTLCAGANATIPDHIHQLWRDRVQRFLAHHDGHAQLALELAASLGQSVDTEEWRRAAQALRLKIPAGLAQDLASARLATLRPHGWSFAHNMLRESLERSARERALWVDLNRACASMLESRHRGAPQVAARLGHHLLQAGEQSRALPALLQGATWSTSRSEYARAMHLISLTRDVLREIQQPARDIIWGRLLLQELLCLTEQGLSQEADALAQRAEKLAREQHWHRLLPELHRLHAHALRKRGDLRGAAHLFLKAHDGFEATGQREALAACLRGLGFVFCQMGELDRAQRLCESAVNAYREDQDLLGVAESHQALAVICRKRDRLPQAERHARDALKLHTRGGYVLGQASSHNTLAEIARCRGQLAQAEHGYRQAITLYERVGSRDTAVPRLNLAMTLLLRGHYRQAAAELQAVQNELQEQDRQGLEAVATWATLPCLAWTGDIERWDQTFAATHRKLQEMGMVDPDLAWLARLSGEVLAQRGQHQRAQLCQSAAASLWKEPATSRRRVNP
jgi:tetratricopeptide (TPR) repeat protein